VLRNNLASTFLPYHSFNKNSNVKLKLLCWL